MCEPLFRRHSECIAARLGYCLLAAYLLLWMQPASARQALALDEASRRAIEYNPQLQVFQWRLQAAEGVRQTAALRPGFELGMEAENVLGSGGYSGTDRAEYTLSLSSIVELGGKRHSRVAVADSRYALAAVEREAQALDVLGQVTQRFIAVLALQERLRVSGLAVALAELSVQSVTRRVEHGAAPDAERLRARAALAQTGLMHAALEAEFASEKMALATLWGEENADFETLSGDLYASQPAGHFEDLYERVVDSPAVQVFATEARLREAELELVRSQSSSDMSWRVGVKRLEEGGDSALVAELSMPLFTGRRNQGEVKAALAERSSVNYRKQSSLLALRARLYTAWQNHRQAIAATGELRESVLPALEAALAQTREAYERGRYRYIDLASVEQELLEARLAAIDAATRALLNQALIEQLTAEPLSAPEQGVTHPRDQHSAN